MGDFRWASLAAGGRVGRTDRPGLCPAGGLRAAIAGTTRSEDSAVLAAPFFRQLRPVFGRGVNLGNALEAPEEGQWGVVLKEEYFQKIHAAGFDSVRIPVRWSAHAGQSAPYRIDPKFFARVDWAIRQALRQRLTPVVNMHNYDEIFVEPDQHRGRFLALWRQIAEHYKDFPASLALELLNEPHAKLTAEKWNRLAAEAIVSVRRSNPTRQIVVGPVGWNSINELPKLELPEGDRHLVVTVHYYNPFQFTHQGASWVGAGVAEVAGDEVDGHAGPAGGRPAGPRRGHRLGGPAPPAALPGRVRGLQQGRPGIACPLDPLCRRRGPAPQDGFRLLGVLFGLRRLRRPAWPVGPAAQGGPPDARSAGVNAPAPARPTPLRKDTPTGYTDNHRTATGRQS